MTEEEEEWKKRFNYYLKNIKTMEEKASFIQTLSMKFFEQEHALWLFKQQIKRMVLWTGFFLILMCIWIYMIHFHPEYARERCFTIPMALWMIVCLVLALSDGCPWRKKK